MMNYGGQMGGGIKRRKKKVPKCNSPICWSQPGVTRRKKGASTGAKEGSEFGPAVSLFSSFPSLFLFLSLPQISRFIHLSHFLHLNNSPPITGHMCPSHHLSREMWEVKSNHTDQRKHKGKIQTWKMYFIFRFLNIKSDYSELDASQHRLVNTCFTHTHTRYVAILQHVVQIKPSYHLSSSYQLVTWSSYTGHSTYKRPWFHKDLAVFFGEKKTFPSVVWEGVCVFFPPHNGKIICTNTHTHSAGTILCPQLVVSWNKCYVKTELLVSLSLSLCIKFSFMTSSVVAPPWGKLSLRIEMDGGSMFKCRRRRSDIPKN